MGWSWAPAFICGVGEEDGRSLESLQKGYSAQSAAATLAASDFDPAPVNVQILYTMHTHTRGMLHEPERRACLHGIKRSRRLVLMKFDNSLQGRANLKYLRDIDDVLLSLGARVRPLLRRRGHFTDALRGLGDTLTWDELGLEPLRRLPS